MPYTIEVDLALPRVKVSNILQLFQILSKKMSTYTGLSEQFLLDSMVDKESQSQSGMGGGVAVPNIQSHKIDRRYVMVVSLERPVHFEGPDEKPVDLVCLLLSPESDGPIHLRGLSRISRLFKNEELCQKLREANDAEAMRALFVNPEGWLMAA